MEKELIKKLLQVINFLARVAGNNLNKLTAEEIELWNEATIEAEKVK